MEIKFIKTIKKILNILGWMIILLLVGVCILFSVARVSEKHISVFGYSLFIIQSESMEPELHKNDLVIVRSGIEIKEGDIITFYNDGSFPDKYKVVTHRVYKIVLQEGTYFYYTMGDNNEGSADAGERTIDEICGICVSKVRNLGLLFNYLQSPIGLITVGIVFLLYTLKDLIFTKLFMREK